MPALLAILSAIGFVNAGYFVLAYHGVLAQAAGIPNFCCRSSESLCLTVLKTPYARVFGVPNATLGAIFYLANVCVAMLWLLGRLPPWLWQADVAVSGFTLLFGLYLIGALRKLRMPCPLCYLGHAINLGIFVVLLAG
jgi:uncharacterized membrane protein